MIEYNGRARFREGPDFWEWRIPRPGRAVIVVFIVFSIIFFFSYFSIGSSFFFNDKAFFFAGGFGLIFFLPVLFFLGMEILITYLVLRPETLRLQGQQLILYSPMPGSWRTVRLDWREIRNMRLADPAQLSWAMVSRSISASRARVSYYPRLVFDYGMRSYHFGIGLDEPEAKFLCEWFKERLPSRENIS